MAAACALERATILEVNTFYYIQKSSSNCQIFQVIFFKILKSIKKQVLLFMSYWIKMMHLLNETFLQNKDCIQFDLSVAGCRRGKDFLKET